MFSCVLVSLCGCDNKPSIQIKPLAEDAVVLAFGDSLTAGTGARSSQSYPSVLQRLTGYTVINSGVPGELTGRGRDRLTFLLESYNPDLVVICHGGNDFLHHVSNAEIIRNIDAMINAAEKRDIDIILIGVPQARLPFKVLAFYKELAEQHNIPFDGDILADILSDSSLKSDQVHPNAQGYQKLVVSRKFRTFYFSLFNGHGFSVL